MTAICKILCVVLLALAFSAIGVAAKCQAGDAKAQEYKFDTLLSHGYSLVYKTDDSLQYLYLRNGDKLTKISWEYKENKQSLLGYIAHDFDKYFVLLRTLHVTINENPMDFELFKKSTAKVVLKGYYIDAKDSVILWHNQEKMQLYNVNTAKTESFALPHVNAQFADKLINMIRIKEITPQSLVIEYFDDYDFIKITTRKYTRHPEL